MGSAQLYASRNTVAIVYWFGNLFLAPSYRLNSLFNHKLRFVSFDRVIALFTISFNTELWHFITVSVFRGFSTAFHAIHLNFSTYLVINTKIQNKSWQGF